MEFLKKFNLKPWQVLKIAVLSVLGIAALVFVLSLINSSVRPVLSGRGRLITDSVTPAYYGSGSVAGEEAAYNKKYAPMMDLSSRNVAESMSPPMPGTVGNNAEAFEVTDYNATVETTGDKDSVCRRIADLKSLTHVIFENAQESDRNCNFTFKVEQARTAEILAIIKELNPKDLYENVRTIKSQLDDFTSQTEILEKKRASIDETLKNALTAYDQITALAVKTQDAASLAKIIDSKVQLIERMTQERINITQQLDYLTRAKAQQLDRLDYTYFNVNVYENKYFDGRNIKDSWKAAIQEFFYNINYALQDASINLVATLIMLIPYIIYALLVVVAAKYGWRLVKRIWQK